MSISGKRAAEDSPEGVGDTKRPCVKAEPAPVLEDALSEISDDADDILNRDEVTNFGKLSFDILKIGNFQFFDLKILGNLILSLKKNGNFQILMKKYTRLSRVNIWTDKNMVTRNALLSHILTVFWKSVCLDGPSFLYSFHQAIRTTMFCLRCISNIDIAFRCRISLFS